MLLELPKIPVDGNWLVLRNWFASGKPQDKGKALTSSLSSISKLIKTSEYGSEIVMLFDCGKWRYRPKTKFPNYKESRDYDNSFDVIWDVMNTLHEILPKLGIRSYKISGVEADDLGYLEAHKDERPTMLYTKDRDWYLSLNDSTIVNNDVDGLVSEADLYKMYKVDSAKDYLIYKAIVGDGSDDIPGVSIAPLSPEAGVVDFKNNLFDGTTSYKIQKNIEIMRIDYIINDMEVYKMYNEQTDKLETGNDVIRTLMSAHMYEYPRYFHGVFGKYNREVSTRVLDDLKDCYLEVA